MAKCKEILAPGVECSGVLVVKDGVEYCPKCRWGEEIRDKISKLPTSSRSSEAAGCAKKNAFDLDAAIKELLNDMRKGFGTSTISILQTEVGGRRVEIQLYATGDENDFGL